MSETLAVLLDRLAQDRSLDDPQRLRERIQTLDRLEHFRDFLPDAPSTAPLRERLDTTVARLESVNDRLYAQLRANIRNGDTRDLREWMTPAESATDAVRGEAYDHLDALLGGVLQLSEPGGEVAPPRPEMVFYQPTPARHIVDLVGRLGLSERDELIDLGSGLGHVPLLASLLTPARCVGVELEPAYVASARRCAEDLRLAKVSFVQADARDADLSKATVFYLYTPFTGSVMARMLELIHAQAQQREIRIGSLGPCTQVLAGQPWLRGDNAPLYPDRVALFRPIA